MPEIGKVADEGERESGEKRMQEFQLDSGSHLGPWGLNVDGRCTES